MEWPSTLVSLPGEICHGQRSLEGYSPWGLKSWTRLKWLSSHTRPLEESHHTWGPQSLWRNGAHVSHTSQTQMCAEAKQNQSLTQPTPLILLWGDCSHPGPWLRKNIPLSEAKGHHVISSCAWQGSLEQAILIAETLRQFPAAPWLVCSS